MSAEQKSFAVRFLDENRLVSGSLDRTVRFWPLK